MKSIIAKLNAGQNLTPPEMENAIEQIMAGAVSKEEMASFLLSLRAKGESVDEITAAAKIMRKFVVRVPVSQDVVLDTCGTGGDKSGTFNISTIAAFVVAGCGVTVAKHGNRSISSRCGSADVLEALGVKIDMPVERLSECLDKTGIAFLFAQKLHPAMKNGAPVRKELGVETIFNILGPLTNPAAATHQMMGVYKKELVEPLAHVLKNLGLKKALVVHGSDGLDEITTTGPTYLSEFNGQQVNSFMVYPKAFGIKEAGPSDIKGGDLTTNVMIAERILNGEEGPKTDIVLLNAACALYISDRVGNVPEGIALARESVDSGRAKEKLEMLRDFTSHGA